MLRARAALWGAEHTETVVAMANLAKTLRARGLLQESADLASQVCCASKRPLEYMHVCACNAGSIPQMY